MFYSGSFLFKEENRYFIQIPTFLVSHYNIYKKVLLNIQYDYCLSSHVLFQNDKFILTTPPASARQGIFSTEVQKVQ